MLGGRTLCTLLLVVALGMAPALPTNKHTPLATGQGSKAMATGHGTSKALATGQCICKYMAQRRPMSRSL
jgi:Na+/glutamate symporter